MKIRVWSRFRLTTKILIVCLLLSVVSLLVVGILANSNLRAMGRYVMDSHTTLGDTAIKDSTEALELQGEKELLRLAADQAALSETLFKQIAAEASIITEYASRLWTDPGSFGSRQSYSQTEAPDNELDASVYVLAPGVNSADVQAEIDFSASMDDIFMAVYPNDPNLAWVYMGTESGLVRIYPWTSGLPAEYDPRERGWYQSALQSGQVVWSELYLDAGGQGLMVTCSIPVYNSTNEIIGVVAADVTLETINDRVINTQIGQRGYAFLIDDSGNIIARPGLSEGDSRWDETYETENLLLDSDDDLKGIIGQMVAGESGISQTMFEGGERYIAFAPLPSPNWSLGIVLPISEITEPVDATRDRISEATGEARQHIDAQISREQLTFLGIFLGMVLLVIGLSFWLARSITRPIIALTNGAKIIGDGNLDHRVEVKSGDEIEELANSLNSMSSDLKLHMERLRQTTAEKERVLKELDIARGIQQTFLPESPPSIEGIELAAVNVPALEVGGDFYDFIPVGIDRWGLVIADVSGKGVPAALFMALSRTLLRAYAVGNPSASEAVLHANRTMAEDDRADMFVTLFYGVLDTKRKALTYVNAGHNPPFVTGKDNTGVVILAAKGVAVGIIPDIELEEKEILLQKGDTLVLYTDGVTESINRNNEEFGQERLARIVQANPDLSAQDLIQLIQQEVISFTDGQPPFDDLTLMIIKIS